MYDMPYKDKIKDKEYQRKYQKVYQKKRYEREKSTLIAKLGGKCFMCGTTENLEFDHSSRSGKNFAITAKMHSKELDAELKKCQLLCHKCHLKKTRSDLMQHDYSHLPKTERNKYKRRVYYYAHRDEINQKRRDRRKTQAALQKRSTGGST